MQAVTVGLHLAFWAMLPDTVEWGQRRTGRRVEAAAFGLATLFQRGAIGVATLILGLGFDEAGFRPQVLQSAATAAGMRQVVAGVGFSFFLLSAIAMWLSPLRRGVHASAVRDLEGQAASSEKLP